MSEYTNVLGFNIYNKSKEKFLEKILNKDKVNIISGNPEILYKSYKDDCLRDFLRKDCSIIISDGIGTKIAAKLKGDSIEEKIAGIDVMTDILKFCSQNNKSVYFLGSSEDVVTSLITKIKKDFVDLRIVGYNDGFFDEKMEKLIIDDIKKSKPFALFVAMGCPKQELFINKYIDILDSTIFMGVGGSFDVLSGKMNRAPKWMISLGLEWLYRVIKEPFRIKRLLVIPKFLFKSLFAK